MTDAELVARLKDNDDAAYREAEVAQAMDKTENAIKQLQFRALRSLGRLMERRG